MKIFYSLFFIFLTSYIPSVFAQAPPQGINYQAVARDNSGNPLVAQSVTVIFRLHQNSASGPVVYRGTQPVTTNAFGLFTAVIGQTSSDSGSFAAISWGANSYWLQVIVNGNNMGATQFMSVPYALFAGNGSPPASGFSNMQVFNASGNWISPPGVNKIMVEVWGGGGGGGSGSGSGSLASGGGGGGYGKGIYTVTPSTNYSVTVGTGGVVGTTGNAGFAGGTSSFGSLISASGGGGGTSGNPTGVGAGGNTFTGVVPFTLSGGSGFTGCFNYNNFYLLPHGGMAGKGGAGGSGFLNAAGGFGVAPGGGGGGSIGNPIPGLGGMGAPGRVVVWW